MKKLFTLFLILFLLPCVAGADEAGFFRLDWFDGGAMGISFIDIPVDAEAAMICLWPKETVHNVVLEKLHWENGIAAEVIHRCDTLESNQVLRIQGYLTDVLPAFRVTCTNPDGEEERWYITDSGMDGSLLLLPPESVEAVFVPDSLAEAEEISCALYAFLAGDLSDEDRGNAQRALYDIWEEARIASVQEVSNETDFLKSRDAVLKRRDLLTAAEMTRAHVYELYKMEVPAISSDGSLG